MQFSLSNQDVNNVNPTEPAPFPSRRPFTCWCTACTLQVLLFINSSVTHKLEVVAFWFQVGFAMWMPLYSQESTIYKYWKNKVHDTVPTGLEPGKLGTTPWLTRWVQKWCCAPTRRPWALWWHIRPHNSPLGDAETLVELWDSGTRTSSTSALCRSYTTKEHLGDVVKVFSSKEPMKWQDPWYKDALLHNKTSYHGGNLSFTVHQETTDKTCKEWSKVPRSPRKNAGSILLFVSSADNSFDLNSDRAVCVSIW